MSDDNTEKTEIEKNESQPQRLNMLPALLSLFCPGLGQLSQKRTGAAVGFFMLFLLTGFLPIIILSLLFIDRFSQESLGIHVLHIVVFAGVCVPLMLAFFCSVIDAVAWKQGDRTRFKPLLTVGGVIFLFVLVALLLPSVPSAREAARRMQCTNNLKQIGLGFHNYLDTYGHFPPAYSVDENGKPLHSWRVLILPFMEQKTLYDQIRLDEPWDSEYNRQFHDTLISVFRCPSGSSLELLKRAKPDLKTDGNCCYSVVIGPETAFSGSEAVSCDDITDGTSNTILVVERLMPVCWMDPNNEIGFDTACEGINHNVYGIGSAHAHVANVLMADGSVQSLLDSTEPEFLRALLTKSGDDNSRFLIK